MKIPEKPHLHSYEAVLTDEQRVAFRALLLSGITLAEAQQKAPPWPSGPEQGNNLSIASLGRTRLRLRIEERIVLRFLEKPATGLPGGQRKTRNAAIHLLSLWEDRGEGTPSGRRKGQKIQANPSRSH